MCRNLRVHSLGLVLGGQSLAFKLVTLLPVVLLTVGRAVERLLAGAAYLVLPDFALGSAAEVALLDERDVLLAVLGGLGLELELLEVLEPLLGRVVHPRVDEGDRFAAHVLLWELLRREFINEVVLLFLPDQIETVLEIGLNQLDGYLGSLLLVSLAFLLLAHAVVG